MSKFLIPYNFVPGMKAKAEEVNANFNAIKLELESMANNSNEKIGDLSALTTEDKTNLVSAINEAMDSGGRNLGEIVTSTIPLVDAGLHLADGTLLQGEGIYADFVSYMADLVETEPDLFCTEEEWQEAVADNGYCIKYVYDSVNSTLRLPKIDFYQVISDKNLKAKGNGMTLGLSNGLETAGLMSSSSVSISYNTNIYGANVGAVNPSGGFSTPNTSIGITLDETKSGIETNIENNLSQFYTYIVVATTTKTGIQVDIDEIATDLNGKADKDLNNISPSQSAKEEIISWSLPDYSAGINLSGNSFTAPVDGFATIQPYRGPNCAIYVNGYFVGLGSCENAAATIQVYLAKDDVLTTDSGFSFAQGTSIFYPLKGVN